jgi:hypothetical protein
MMRSTRNSKSTNWQSSALGSLCTLEEEFQELIESFSKEVLSRLEPVGRALETHVN